MDVVGESEGMRPELLAYCYRMLGSVPDAEDAVQETMVRAWRAGNGYDPARASLRTWLYRIAGNVCLTMLADRKRRWLPDAFSGPGWTPDLDKLERREDVPWLGPVPDSLLDPAAVAESRDSIRLAFVAALQHLPPRQRAVLILRDVLAMPAAEVAGLLDLSVAAANSALQRARTSLAARQPVPDGLAEPSEEVKRGLLGRYLTAFEAMDVEALKQTLREDALMQMPPFPAWYTGRRDIAEFLASAWARGGSYRFIPLRANATDAVAVYLRRDTPAYEFRQIQVITLSGGGVARIDGFHDKNLPGIFGIPASLASLPGTAVVVPRRLSEALLAYLLSGRWSRWRWLVRWRSGWPAVHQASRRMMLSAQAARVCSRAVLGWPW